LAGVLTVTPAKAEPQIVSRHTISNAHLGMP
jgi:hypothetical protein